MKTLKLPLAASSSRALSNLALALMFIGLAGCAAPARVDSMMVSPPPGSLTTIPPGLRSSIAIRDVTGGKETNPMWMSNVGSSEFEQALEGSLRAAGLLAASRVDGKYLLIAHLEHLEQPMIGASLTVTATVQYNLSERASGKTVFVRKVTEPYTAQFGDALLAVERLRLANEGAIRVNIARFISELSVHKFSEVGSLQLALR